MKIVTTSSCFYLVDSVIDSVIDRTKEFPDQIFRSNFHHFLFITFDELYLAFFFTHIREYLNRVNESMFWLSVIDPDPVRYYFDNFGFYGAFEFTTSDTENNYIEAINDFPQRSHADALIHNSNKLVLLSPQGTWAIVGDRGSDVAICAFASEDFMDIFRSVYNSDLLQDVHVAAEFAYPHGDDLFKKNAFVDNYSKEA